MPLAILLDATAANAGIYKSAVFQVQHWPRAWSKCCVPETMLSAVVTSYLDAQAIPLMHARLTEVFTALGVRYEIIFVNDGSPDDTDAVLKNLTQKDDHVIAVEHSRNFGSQNAFVSG